MRPCCWCQCFPARREWCPAGSSARCWGSGRGWCAWQVHPQSHSAHPHPHLTLLQSPCSPWCWCSRCPESRVSWSPVAVRPVLLLAETSPDCGHCAQDRREEEAGDWCHQWSETRPPVTGDNQWSRSWSWYWSGVKHISETNGVCQTGDNFNVLLIALISFQPRTNKSWQSSYQDQERPTLARTFNWACHVVSRGNDHVGWGRRQMPWKVLLTNTSDQDAINQSEDRNVTRDNWWTNQSGAGA